MKDGNAHARRHGTRTGRPIGRPRLEFDLVRVRDALLARDGEPGLTPKHDREFRYIPTWIYANIVLLLEEGVRFWVSIVKHCIA